MRTKYHPDRYAQRRAEDEHLKSHGWVKTPQGWTHARVNGAHVKWVALMLVKKWVLPLP